MALNESSIGWDDAADIEVRDEASWHLFLARFDAEWDQFRTTVKDCADRCRESRSGEIERVQMIRSRIAHEQKRAADGKRRVERAPGELAGPRAALVQLDSEQETRFRRQIREVHRQRRWRIFLNAVLSLLYWLFVTALIVGAIGGAGFLVVHYWQEIQSDIAMTLQWLIDLVEPLLQ